MDYSTSITVNLGGKNYQVPYPNVGEEFQIEAIKMFLTSDRYGDLARSGHSTANRLLNLVDAVAHFSILVPEIKAAFKLEDFQTLAPKTQKEYIRAWIDVYAPWKTDTYKAMFDDEKIEDAAAGNTANVEESAE